LHRGYFAGAPFGARSAVRRGSVRTGEMIVWKRAEVKVVAEEKNRQSA
jgi:hypothetical protein